MFVHESDLSRSLFDKMLLIEKKIEEKSGESDVIGRFYCDQWVDCDFIDENTFKLFHDFSSRDRGNCFSFKYKNGYVFYWDGSVCVSNKLTKIITKMVLDYGANALDVDAYMLCGV